MPRRRPAGRAVGSSFNSAITLADRSGSSLRPSSPPPTLGPCTILRLLLHSLLVRLGVPRPPERDAFAGGSVRTLTVRLLRAECHSLVVPESTVNPSLLGLGEIATDWLLTFFKVIVMTTVWPFWLVWRFVVTGWVTG